MYIPIQSKLNIHQATYFIRGYSVGSDHSPVHLELHIGSGEGGKSVFKWNVFYLKREILDKIEMYAEECSFLSQTYIGRFCRQVINTKP